MLLICVFAMWCAASIAGAGMKLAHSIMAICGAGMVALTLVLLFSLQAAASRTPLLRHCAPPRRQPPAATATATATATAIPTTIPTALPTTTPKSPNPQIRPQPHPRAQLRRVRRSPSLQSTDGQGQLTVVTAKVLSIIRGSEWARAILVYCSARRRATHAHFTSATLHVTRDTLSPHASPQPAPRGGALSVAPHRPAPPARRYFNYVSYISNIAYTRHISYINYISYISYISYVNYIRHISDISYISYMSTSVTSASSPTRRSVAPFVHRVRF